MIDFHSHILPALDDGSKSVEESVALLDMLAEQGIKTVVATPHFDVQRESPTVFKKRRQESYEMLRTKLKGNHPEILLGAEVGYYPGIERRDVIRSLCIGDSHLLLLEMPISVWTEYTVREIVEFASGRAINIALAHAERYIGLQSARTVQRLNEAGILMQYNAEFFLRFGQKRRALKMLERGEIHLIGSDCHNINVRPPRIGEAYALIKHKLGDDFYSFFCEYGYSLLNTKSKTPTF